MKTNTSASPRDNQTRSSFWIKLLIAGLLASALAGFLRGIQSIHEWSWLQYLGIVPGPLYLAVTGFVWGSLALAAGIALWMKKGWSYRFARSSVFILILTSWLDRLFFTRFEGAWTNLPFSIGMSAAALAYTLVVLAKKSSPSS